MHGKIPRDLEKTITESLQHFPAIAMLGPRQCGKSTLAKMLLAKRKESVYLDLEKASDLKKLDDPELFFSTQKNKLLCIDEIQRRPELFSSLRSILDENEKNGQLLLLGSASRDLIKQSSETLAGRIVYKELTPFKLTEIHTKNNPDIINTLWVQGGFPRSFLMEKERLSLEWRENFIRTFLERDIVQLGFNIPPGTMRRLWSMCAHIHGDLLNTSKLGESLGLSHTTVRSYIDLLEQTYMLRVLQPYIPNTKKRIVKSPKIYIRDSGILHALLSIKDMEDLLGHPVFGSSWEGLVIENILSEFPDWNGYYYRTSNGAEIDLVLEKGMKKIAIECKASSAPDVSRGFWNSLDDLDISKAWIIAPVKEGYPLKDNVHVCSLIDFINTFDKSDI